MTSAAAISNLGGIPSRPVALAGDKCWSRCKTPAGRTSLKENSVSTGFKKSLKSAVPWFIWAASLGPISEKKLLKALQISLGLFRVVVAVLISLTVL